MVLHSHPDASRQREMNAVYALAGAHADAGAARTSTAVPASQPSSKAEASQLAGLFQAEEEPIFKDIDKELPGDLSEGDFSGEEGTD